MASMAFSAHVFGTLIRERKWALFLTIFLFPLLRVWLVLLVGHCWSLSSLPSLPRRRKRLFFLPAVCRLPSAGCCHRSDRPTLSTEILIPNCSVKSPILPSNNRLRGIRGSQQPRMHMLLDQDDPCARMTSGRNVHSLSCARAKTLRTSKLLG
ncbi:hypothetical protein B0T17DRAFT_180871 [Bombardia bombarda]|uniref:Uncharacterized protein n=1 Tax=Bombardia bombarda TaxID=252184 RepID=A0AA40C8L2_9PEZI|nr:hypothetical protein B0T17DRAFT_180871 [Bombardia bombarda]